VFSADLIHVETTNTAATGLVHRSHDSGLAGSWVFPAFPLETERLECLETF